MMGKEREEERCVGVNSAPGSELTRLNDIPKIEPIPLRYWAGLSASLSPVRRAG